MPNEAVTIYVTKDAETKGIRLARAHIDLDGWASVVGDWRTLRPSEFAMMIEKASLNAEARRVRKLAALEKQIAAIRAVDLTRPVEG